MSDEQCLGSDGPYHITWTTGVKELKRPTYKLSTVERLEGHWPFRRAVREHSLTCNETGMVISGVDDQGLVMARAYLGRIT